MIKKLLYYLLNPKSVYLKIVRFINPRYGLNNSDIILATFPKSGTTWFRLIFANLVSVSELNGDIIDHKELNEKFNASFEPNWKPKIKYSSLPLIRNTHRNFDNRAFKNNKTIYLFRNPYDVMVSYYIFMKSLKNNEYKKDISSFIRDDKFGIEAWCKNLKSWFHNATVTINYEFMKRDTFGAVKKVLKEINLDKFDNDSINKAIENSDFKIIKKMEKERGLDRIAQKRHKSSFKFARKGETGQWRELLDEEDMSYIKNVLEKRNLCDFINKYKF